MKTSHDARPYHSYGLNNNLSKLTSIENISFFQYLEDLISRIYKFLDSTNDKNNFSLTCTKWKIVADNHTKIITIFKKFNTYNEFFAIAQRFKFIEYFKISPEDEYHEGIRYFKNLTYLNLGEYYHDRKINSDCVKNFTNLRILKLKYNKLNDSAITNLTNLTSLALEHDFIISNSAITNLTKLTSLTLSYNHIISNSAITNLTNLTEINLYQASLIGDDPKISNLINLRKLSISGSCFSDSDLINLTNLSSLELSSCRITRKGISILTNLTELKLHEEKYNGSIKELKKLTSLRAIDVEDEDIINLTNLQSLEIITPTVTANGIEPLTKLTKLRITGTSFDEDWIPHLTNLTYLRIDDQLTGGMILNTIRTLTNLKNLDVESDEPSIFLFT